MPVLVQGSRWSYVELVQSILKRLGFYNEKNLCFCDVNILNVGRKWQKKYSSHYLIMLTSKGVCDIMFW